jgi:hypothetical protein
MIKVLPILKDSVILGRDADTALVTSKPEAINHVLP